MKSQLNTINLDNNTPDFSNTINFQTSFSIEQHTPNKKCPVRKKEDENMKLA